MWWNIKMRADLVVVFFVNQVVDAVTLTRKLNLIKKFASRVKNVESENINDVVYLPLRIFT